ncbi:MAG TPA: hypothetical protein ENH82_06140 [bacterium]|nr:hypothetical protein [bacterium]
MGRIEAIKSMEFIEGLWPNWKPTPQEADLWCSKLNQYDQIDVEQAAKEYKMTKAGSFKTPKIYELIAMIAGQHIRNDTGEKLPPYAPIYIQRADGGRKFPIYLLGRDKKTITKDTVPPAAMIPRIAERLVKQYEELYKHEYVYHLADCYEIEVPF